MTDEAIPRVVHWLWLGTLAVPDIFQQYAERWRVHHPSWETRLWREDALPALSCQEAFDNAHGFKRRYDILRLEILRQHGGVIVDMDVEPIRPIDPLLRGVTAFVGRIGDKHIGNQVLGATPGHPFFERAVRGLRENVETDGNASQTAGKDFLRQVLSHYPEDVTVFPERTFYYEPSFEPPRRPHDFPDVYAVHHQLESYAAIPQAETVERRFDQFVSEVKRGLDTVGVSLPAELVARLTKAEHRVRRALRADDHRRRAEARGTMAEREQAAIRHDELEKQWQRRLEDLERQPRARGAHEG
jgi:inositol phosphorylceramide mannosyltransferase catalytic subunit